MKTLLIAFVSALASLSILAEEERAARSIGFEDPGDLETLLDYRLPSWGAWSLTLGASSDIDRNSARVEFYAPSDSTLEEELVMSSKYGASGSVGVRMLREGEKRRGRMDLDLTGRASYGTLEFSRNGTRETNNGSWNLGIDSVFEFRQYVRPAAFLEIGGGISAQRAKATRNSSGLNAGRSNRSAGQFDGEFRLGIGWGRARDVTPLIRAERISERLSTLGREPASHEQIRALAEAIASEGAYSLSYDRSDRYYWSAVLDLLGRENLLTPYEMLFLQEVAREPLGERVQGKELRIHWALARHSHYGNRVSDARERKQLLTGPALSALWSRNMTLEHQVAVEFDAEWLWGSDEQEDSWYRAGPPPPIRLETVDQDMTDGAAQLTLGHLWALADRYLLQSEFSTQFSYLDLRDTVGLQRSVTSAIGSSLEIFVEDKLLLQGGLGASYTEGKTPLFAERWDWRMSVSATFVPRRGAF